MAITEKHYVTFLGPGTFVSEQTMKQIESWDTKAAVGMAEKIKERHNANPYGFYFSTCRESDPIPDGKGGMLEVTPKEIAKGPIHFLGGTVFTINEMRSAPGTGGEILLSNMECNRKAVIVENRNSYRFTTFFDEDHCIVGPDGKIVRRGNDADLMEIRRTAFKDVG